MLIRSADGTKLSVQDWGARDGAEILFIHGYRQCHLSFRRQFACPDLLARFRMVSFDQRGHGWSGCSGTTKSYLDGENFAADVHAVMEATSLRRPTLVGWSYGGPVACDYIAAHGTGRVAGLHLVGTLLASRGAEGTEANGSRSLDETLARSIAYAHSCFATPPSPEAFALIASYNALCSPVASAALLRRVFDHRALVATLEIPMLVAHGRRDELIPPARAQKSAALSRHAELSLYPRSGHSPFFEEAERFNAELARFVSRASSQ